MCVFKKKQQLYIGICKTSSTMPLQQNTICFIFLGIQAGSILLLIWVPVLLGPVSLFPIALLARKGPLEMLIIGHVQT